MISLFLVFSSVLVHFATSGDTRIFNLGECFPKPGQFKHYDNECIEMKITKSDRWINDEIEGEVFEGDTVEVTCYGLGFELNRFQDMQVQVGNDTRKLSYSSSYVNYRTVTKYSVVVDHLDSGEYICNFTTNPTKPLIKKRQLNVIRVQIPQERLNHRENRTIVLGSTEHLECDVEEGLPPPIYKWMKDRKVVENENSRILTIKDAKASNAGRYVCNATNRAGSEYSLIRVDVIQDQNSTMVDQNYQKILESSAVIILILFFGLSILAVYLCSRSGARYSNVKGEDESSKYSPNIGIKLENVKLMEKLGDGNFGKVHAGILDMNQTLSLNVAIKSPKNEGDIFQIRMLKEEYEIMKGIRLHPNILTLIGSVHDPNNTTISHIVFELCELGSLCDYLRLRKYHTSYLINQKNSDLEANTVWNNHYEMLAEQLSFAYQIARGMEFLSSIKCVHRDLAARNVLLKSNKVCRIADFGLTRLHENNDYYRARYQTEVPVRWMSIESIKEGKYTEKSDVWAFGIVLFEIFSLGEKPYPNIESDEVVKYILDGNINEKPEKCHPKIYGIMTKCWRKSPKKRPTFSECSNFFKRCIKCNFPDMYTSLLNLMELEATKQLSDYRS